MAYLIDFTFTPFFVYIIHIHMYSCIYTYTYTYIYIYMSNKILEIPKDCGQCCPVRSPLEEERALKEALRSAWENEASERRQTEEKLLLGR